VGFGISSPAHLTGREWVSLGHPFFAEDKDGVTVLVATEHKYRSVFVAVEYKPGPGRAFVPDYP
jgi:hypothetical protein